MDTLEKNPRIGVAVIVYRDSTKQEIILIKRRGKRGDGTWSLPGGAVDFGELITTTATREVREETGIIISEPSFVCLTENVLDGEHWITLIFTAESVGGVLERTERDKSYVVGWFDPNHIPVPRFHAFDNFLNHKSTYFSEALKNGNV